MALFYTRLYRELVPFRGSATPHPSNPQSPRAYHRAQTHPESRRYPPDASLSRTLVSGGNFSTTTMLAAGLPNVLSRAEVVQLERMQLRLRALTNEQRGLCGAPRALEE